MDLEVFGRHALFFDDDSMATFANSSAALVDWNDLLIDRYDVRHLLSSLPPRHKRRRTISEDRDLETELDKERYLDLPAESPLVPHDDNDLNDVSASTSADGFRAVPFSYGNTSDFNNQMNGEMESGFRPPFPVPEILLQNIPPTEKLHQIIARTALFVSKQGAQSEIVLRVKQGGNPTFGFLMPDHHLHPYFRFLVEHQELLTQKSSDENKKNEGDSGALCLLGSAYGTGEDEDSKDESVTNSKTNNDPDEGDNAVKVADCSRPEESGKIVSERGDAASINSLPCKHNVSAVKRNPAVSPVNVVDIKTNEEGNITERLSTSDKVKSSVMPLQPKFELPVVEPPVDMKRVINKIVDFIHKNGKELEATLAAQDVKYGMFPFLRPASLYHAYYRKVLKEAEESKLSGRCDITEEQEEKQEKANDVKEGDKHTVGNDISHESDKKEKFKMAVGKKEDVHDDEPRPIQPRGITVDANAVAAILQAARRGIRNPQIGILSGNPMNESSQSLGNNGSYTSSQPPVLGKNVGQSSEQVVSGSVVADIAKSGSEADSSEAGLSKEQKLKAERLKRAKMFMAMVKTGIQSTQAEPSRSLSVEPVAPEISESAVNASKPTSREREGSSVLLEAKTRQADDDNRERRSKRNYRPRSGSNKDDEEDDEDESSMEEDTEETRNEKKHSSKRSDSEYRHKHKTRQSSKDRHSRDRHKHDSSSDDEYLRRSRHRHKHSKSTDRHDDLDDSSDNEHGHRHKSIKHDKHVDSSEYKHHRQHKSRKHKHDDSSDDEHYHRHRSSRKKHDDSSNDERSHRRKSRKRLKENKTDNEEMATKSDHSKAADEDKASSSPGVSTSNIASQNEPTQVSEELRAKIRAMLTRTL